MDPVIKVTRIKNRWHARMFYNGELRDEMACNTQCDIGIICREMLRWYDKMGGSSQYADRARHRNKPERKSILAAKGKVWYLGVPVYKVKAMED